MRLFNNDWPTVRMSVTIPNARCPVCGAPVFFYESFTGGRVFFDELGPPWPKHPCTDNTPPPSGACRAAAAKPATTSGSTPAPPQWRREGWIPLETVTVTRADGFSTLRGNGADGGAEIIFSVADHMRCTENDPILVRRSDHGDGTWDISYLPINSRLVKIAPETVQGFPGAATIRDVRMWQRALESDPDARNLVGMSLSFARGKKAEDGTWAFEVEPDWSAAELHFLMAAAAGRWTGFHNLGAMYRHGLGVRHDPELAFHLVMRAAELAGDDECEPSITALSELLDLGWGSEEDRDDAQAIREVWTGEETT
ncbi:MAG: hypothetical protein H6920_09855 [Sphingomonadaceae bacterium]|nr:hypothetical protein [Sphingomonadaceae bacterium]